MLEESSPTLPNPLPPLENTTAPVAFSTVLPIASIPKMNAIAKRIRSPLVCMNVVVFTDFYKGCVSVFLIEKLRALLNQQSLL